MPAFTFEKISPPRAAVSSEPAAQMKPKAAPGARGIVSQMIDRLAATRLQRRQTKLPDRKRA